jgi:hypothetical protein
MTGLPSADISIHSDGERLILPPELDEHEIAAIKEHKLEILKALRSSQMNAAGFYTQLPSSLRRGLQAAPWVAVSIETTALTRYSAPGRISANTRIGSNTWPGYRAINPGASLNTRPRIRVLCVRTDELGACVWDLDALTREDRQQLLHAALDNKIVISHDAGVALSWLFTETAARPSFLLDSMLLMRQLRPETLLRPFRMAVVGDRESQAKAKRLIEREQGVPTASLEWIATSLRMPTPDSSYQEHANWCVSTLSVAHHAHATASVGLPLRIVQFLLPDLRVQEMPAVIRSRYAWYIPFATATTRLAEAHVRGVPFDVEASERLRAECLTNIVHAADELVQVPEFAPLYEQLSNPQIGDTAELTKAMATYAAANGVVVPQTESGSFVITQQAMKISGAEKLPAWSSLQIIKSNKVGHRMLGQYKQAAACDGRMHSLVTFTAATGRSTSSGPTLQNMPRDPRFRELIKARPGHLILAADYAAIELRIAAALAERAVSDLRQRIKQGCIDSWFMEQIKTGVQATRPLPCPREPTKFDIRWLEQAIPAVAQRVLRRDVQTMTSIFSRGLDPHLVTALDMADRREKIDCGRNPVKWLASKDPQAQKELKAWLHDERQKAKPTNFGLLYGMKAEGLYARGVNDYGLSWSREEASNARHAWFSLYPEIRLWHWCTSLLQFRNIPKDRCILWNPYERKLTRPERDIKLYQTTTLSDRPLKILNGPRQAVNYQDQGTGADILAGAIASLPTEIAAMMLIPVHDEVVFEVPANEIDEVQRRVVETMTRAAEEVLGGQIPVEVETAVGESWGKA